jgi:hypothetical protein
VFDVTLFTGVSALVALICAIFCWLRTWDLLVRVRGLEGGFEDLHRRTTSAQKRFAAQTRWDGQGDDDAAILAALNKTSTVPAAIKEPWWRKHRGI